jgi:ribA/ribD-fused uncharacterized protein
MEVVSDELKKELKEFYKGRKLFYSKLFKTPKERLKEKKKTEEKAAKASTKKKKKSDEEEEEAKELSKKESTELFRYSDDGNLEFYEKNGELKNAITLKYYRPPTFEEIDEVEQKRLTVIAEAQEAFEQARRELRALLDTANPEMSDILRLNRKVTEADMALQSARYQIKDVIVIESIDTDKILIDEAGEKRKLFDIVQFKGRTLTLDEQYVREGRNVPQNVLEAAQQAENMRRARKAARTVGVLFFKLPDTNEYGYMSLEWPVIITYNGTRYKSAKHALLGELAKNFKDMAMFGRIQATEDPEALAYNYADSKGATKEAWDSKRAELVQKIVREKFKQNPELGEQLLNTGDVVIAADVIDDTLFGIGRSMEDPKAMKPRKWTGQNLLGKTIEKIRAQLRKERQNAQEVQVEQAVTATGAVTNAVADAAELVTDAVADALPEGATGAVADAASSVAAQAADVTAATMSAIKNFVGPAEAPAEAAAVSAAPSSTKRTLRIVRPVAPAITK